MPLPKPNKGETRKEFFDRCMANPTMTKEFPDAEQRGGVCGSQWRAHLQSEALAMLTAADPLMFEIVEERGEGKGGTVRLPVFKTATIDLQKTAGGGEGEVEITRADLDQMVTNFQSWPGPVPVALSPHVDFEDMGGPQAGFVVALERREDTLWGTLDLNGFLWMVVVEEGAVRGFSPDLLHNAELATAKLEGWSLASGVFTNRPAVDVHFSPRRVAASGVSGDQRVTAFLAFSRPQQAKSEGTMSAEAVASLEAKIEKLQAQLESSQEENSGLKEQVETLQADLKRVMADVATSAAKNTAARVLELKRIACEDKGILPAFFDGVDDDPVKWLETRGLTVAGLESMINLGLENKAEPTPTSSGTSASKNADAAAKLEAKAREVMAEKSCSFDAAMLQIRETEPDLYDAGVAHYEEPATADS